MKLRGGGEEKKNTQMQIICVFQDNNKQVTFDLFYIFTGNGTGANPPLCPAGSFSNATGLETIEQCQICTAGYYCQDPGLIEPTAPCDAGKQ